MSTFRASCAMLSFGFMGDHVAMHANGEGEVEIDAVSCKESAFVVLSRVDANALANWLKANGFGVAE